LRSIKSNSKILFHATTTPYLARLNSTVKRLDLSELEIDELSNSLLDVWVFEQLAFLFIDGRVGSIENKTFVELKKLEFIQLKIQDLSVLKQTNWMINLNFNQTSPPNQLLVYVVDKSNNASIEETEFCKFVEFPFGRSVFFYIQNENISNKIKCSCPLIWLFQNINDYKNMQLNVNMATTCPDKITNSNGFSNFFEKCDFPNRINACKPTTKTTTTTTPITATNDPTTFDPATNFQINTTTEAPPTTTDSTPSTTTTINETTTECIKCDDDDPFLVISLSIGIPCLVIILAVLYYFFYSRPNKKVYDEPIQLDIVDNVPDNNTVQIISADPDNIVVVEPKSLDNTSKVDEPPLNEDVVLVGETLNLDKKKSMIDKFFEKNKNSIKKLDKRDANCMEIPFRFLRNACFLNINSLNKIEKVNFKIKIDYINAMDKLKESTHFYELDLFPFYKKFLLVSNDEAQKLVIKNSKNELYELTHIPTGYKNYKAILHGFLENAVKEYLENFCFPDDYKLIFFSKNDNRDLIKYICGVIKKESHSEICINEENIEPKDFIVFHGRKIKDSTIVPVFKTFRLDRIKYASNQKMLLSFFNLVKEKKVYENFEIEDLVYPTIGKVEFLLSEIQSSLFVYPHLMKNLLLYVKVAENSSKRMAFLAQINENERIRLVECIEDAGLDKKSPMVDKKLDSILWAVNIFEVCFYRHDFIILKNFDKLYKKCESKQQLEKLMKLNEHEFKNSYFEYKKDTVLNLKSICSALYTLNSAS
jgi:hypothetical protein